VKAKNYNVRKKQILAIMSYATHPYTAREITNLCYPIPVSLTCISALLKRYTQQGLLKRKKTDNIYKYTITKKGISRLEYLIGNKSEKAKIDLLVREPINFLRSLRE